MKQAKKRFGRAAVASLFCATVLAASLPALPAAAATLAGDVNLDGSVNLSDVVAMQQYLLQERTLSAEAGANADYNADGVCNVIDLAMIKRTVLQNNPINDTIAIHLSDSGITVENDTKGVTSVSGKTVTISASGSYTVDGSMADGQILVNIPDTTADADDVELILNNVTMTSSTGAPCIYTQSAVKTKLTVTGTNTFTDTATAANVDTSGVIYADGKLTVTKNSTGTLQVTSSMNAGLYATKNINLNGGTIAVNTDVDSTSDADAIKTKKTLTVEGATVAVDASADGLKSTKELVNIVSGNVSVKAGNDAIQAATDINISGGTVVAGGDRGFRLDDGGKLNITGGDVLATATDYQITNSTDSLATVDLSGCTQGVMMLDLAAEQAKKQPITVQQNGNTVYEMTTNKKCSYALLSGSGLTASGSYTTAVNGAAQGHTPSGSTTQESTFVMSGTATEFYQVAATGTVVTPTDDTAVATISYSNSGVQLLNASGKDVSSSNSSGITVDGSTVTLTQPATVDVTGESSNARIVVNVDKTTYADGVVELCLKNATLSNATAAPIYVEAIGDEVVLNSSSGTVNTISDGTSHTDTYVDNDGVTNTVNGAVFSRDDLKLKGSGSLTINGNTEDGLVCKNDLKLYNGTITVTAKDDAIRGNDSITIGNASATDYKNLNVTATSTAGDAFKTKDTDTTSGKGYLTINGGTIQATAYADAFHSSQTLTVNGGDINIQTTCPASNSNTGGWGGFPGGGGWGGSMSFSTGTLTINDGYLVVRAEGDGLDSNGDLIINGGTVLVYGPTTGGNGIFDKGDGNYSFQINGGTVWGCGTSDMFESPNTTYLSGTVSATAGATFAAADASGNVSSIMTVPSDMNMSNAMLFYCGSDVSSVGLYSGGTYSGGTMNADGYATGGTLSGGSSVSSSSSGGGNNRPGGRW